MKYLTLAIVSFICLGWQTGVISSKCSPSYVHNCIKGAINCTEVGHCYRKTFYCWDGNVCFENEPMCRGPLRIMGLCANLGNCTDRYRFKDNVMNICMISRISIASAASSVHAGFAATALLWVSYYFRE